MATLRDDDPEKNILKLSITNPNAISFQQKQTSVGFSESIDL